MANNVYESLSELGNTEFKTTQYLNSEQGKAIHRNYSDVTGNEIKVFTENFIKILDISIVKNNKHFMTKEQQKFFEQYCIEADNTLSNEMKQFDTFLGEYIGEDDG